MLKFLLQKKTIVIAVTKNLGPLKNCSSMQKKSINKLFENVIIVANSF